MAKEESTRTINPSQKVGLGEKICFFFCNVGNIPLMTLLNSYFLIFYTDVVGLDAGALATLFLISKVVDAVSDPLTGYLLDRVKPGKWGKFRPTLIIGTVICSINYALLWFGAVWSPVYKYVIVYVTYLALGFTFDIMDISLNSILPVMSSDTQERNTLGGIKGVAYTGGMLVISIVAPYIVADSTLESYYVLIFGSLAVVVVCSIGGALGLKERVKFVDDEGNEEEHYSIKEMLRFLVMRPVLVVFAVNLLCTIGGNISSGASTYFYTYVMGDLTVYSLVSVISTVAAIPAMFVGLALSNRIGKKRVYVIAYGVGAAFSFIRLFDVTNLVLLYVGTALSSFMIGLCGALSYGLQADNTTYVQYTSGKHAEGAIASLSSLVTKVAQGIGGAIPGYVLEWTGYVASAEVQTAAALNGITACAVVLPAVGYLVSALIMALGYNLTNEDVQTMSAAIAERENA